MYSMDITEINNILKLYSSVIYSECTSADTFWLLSVIFVVQLAVQQYILSVVSDDEDHRCVQNSINSFKSSVEKKKLYSCIT